MSAAAGDLSPADVDAAARRLLVERWTFAAEALEMIRAALVGREGPIVAVAAPIECWRALLAAVTSTP